MAPVDVAMIKGCRLSLSMIVLVPSIAPTELTSCSLNSGILSSMTSIKIENEDFPFGTVMVRSKSSVTPSVAVNPDPGSVSTPVIASLLSVSRDSVLVLKILSKICS